MNFLFRQSPPKSPFNLLSPFSSPFYLIEPKLRPIGFYLRDCTLILHFGKSLLTLLLIPPFTPKILTEKMMMYIFVPLKLKQ